MPTSRKLLFFLIVLTALGGSLWAVLASRAEPRQPIGLFTTLPVFWNEASDISEIINHQEQPHWARATISSAGEIVGLDLLSKAQLGPLRRLMIAQPRPLSPEENVALDDWVRDGGRLLLLADPALTQESAFALGDPRRPQAVALLSPILRRWGLELQFDDGQPFGEHQVEASGAVVPVNLPGRFSNMGGSNCTLSGEGLVANCRIGKGRVIAMADAALLEPDDADGARSKALAVLLQSAFSGN